MASDKDIWLQLTSEESLEPDPPICDPHHHLWDRPDSPDSPGSRYLLNDLVQDIGGGHNIKTVFIDCRAMYRADGPPEMKPIGETEFVQGIAAQSASGQYGTMRVATGIVSHADLRLGTKVS
jgi:L-fuconolactonase